MKIKLKLLFGGILELKTSNISYFEHIPSNQVMSQAFSYVDTMTSERFRVLETYEEIEALIKIAETPKPKKLVKQPTLSLEN